jgi:hypothetical protein
MSDLPNLLRPGLCGRGVSAAAGTKSQEQATIISPPQIADHPWLGETAHQHGTVRTSRRYD